MATASQRCCKIVKKNFKKPITSCYMARMDLLWFFLIILICYCNVEIVLGANAPTKNEYRNCTMQMSFRLVNTVMMGKGTVLGRVLVCEDSMWKNLYDNDWTLSDARVACRTFQYSPIGES